MKNSRYTFWILLSRVPLVVINIYIYIYPIQIFTWNSEIMFLFWKNEKMISTQFSDKANSYKFNMQVFLKYFIWFMYYICQLVSIVICEWTIYITRKRTITTEHIFHILFKILCISFSGYFTFPILQMK